MQAADVPSTVQQLSEQFDFDEDDIIFISAKNGTNVEQVFDAIVNRISPPAVPENDNAVEAAEAK